jgi:hypothetical protein
MRKATVDVEILFGPFIDVYYEEAENIDSVVEFLKKRKDYSVYRRYDKSYYFLDSIFKNKIGLRFNYFAVEQVLAWLWGISIGNIYKPSIDRILKLYNAAIANYGDSLAGAILIIDRELGLVRGIRSRYDDSKFITAYDVLTQLFLQPAVTEVFKMISFRYDHSRFRIIGRNFRDVVFEIMFIEPLDMLAFNTSDKSRVPKLRIPRKITSVLSDLVARLS